MKVEIVPEVPYDEPIDDITVVIPFKIGGNKTWLRQAKSGFPKGQKLVVVENDGDMAEALNDAITNHVETEWVYRFDADDVATPGLLHKLRDAVWDGSALRRGGASQCSSNSYAQQERRLYPSARQTTFVLSS